MPRREKRSFDPEADRPSGGIVHALRALYAPLRLVPAAPTRPDLVYKRTRAAGRRLDLRLDAYLPQGPGPHPAYLLVHGGGFILGSRRMKPIRYLTTRLAQEGVAAFALDYRKLQQGGVLPRPVRDVRDAAAFVAERAGEFGVDPARLFLAGFSAGAALALLAMGLRDDGSPRPRAAGAVSVFGPTDFSRLRGRAATALRRMLTGERTAAGMRARSPIAHADFPEPLLLLHGDRDAMTPLAHSEAYAAERKRLARPTELRVYEGAPHAFTCLEDTPYPERCVADLLSFLREGI